MASSRSFVVPLRLAFSTTRQNASQRPFHQISRGMATVNSSPNQAPPSSYLTTSVPEHIAPSQVTATVYSFPQMEPLQFVNYPSNHLHLPLRRDILHRAVVYEGDMTRQGTASTKWRREVHGSTRKLHPQKGTGRARVGDKKSPIRRGGGVAFGPKPRDFSTKLPRKVYDLAWRTALSYRYRRGELIIIEDDVKDAYMFQELNSSTLFKALGELFESNGWGNGSGRSTLILSDPHARLERAMSRVGEHGRLLRGDDVDVKDLLETGRLIMERQALNQILKEHETDLTRTRRLTKRFDEQLVEEEWEDVEGIEEELKTASAEAPNTAIPV